jgi:hypothetical protein
MAPAMLSARAPASAGTMQRGVPLAASRATVPLARSSAALGRVPARLVRALAGSAATRRP